MKRLTRAYFVIVSLGFHDDAYVPDERYLPEVLRMLKEKNIGRARKDRINREDSRFLDDIHY